MADVFISYAAEDRERARAVACALEARGWSVWWDRKIVAGQSFDEIIEKELDAARSVVVLWSRTSTISEWVSLIGKSSVTPVRLVCKRTTVPVARELNSL